MEFSCENGAWERQRGLERFGDVWRDLETYIATSWQAAAASPAEAG